MTATATAVAIILTGSTAGHLLVVKEVHVVVEHQQCWVADEDACFRKQGECSGLIHLRSQDIWLYRPAVSGVTHTHNIHSSPSPISVLLPHVPLLHTPRADPTVCSDLRDGRAGNPEGEGSARAAHTEYNASPTPKGSGSSEVRASPRNGEILGSTPSSVIPFILEHGGPIGISGSLAASEAQDGQQEACLDDVVMSLCPRCGYLVVSFVFFRCVLQVGSM